MDHEAARVRRGIYLGLFFVILTLLMALLDLGDVFSLEQRIYGYVVVINGKVSYVSATPTYIYLWRAAAVLFLEWVMTYLVGSIRPYKSLLGMGIVIGVSFVIIHYSYLLSLHSMDLGIQIYPLTYRLVTQGNPILYLDWGQVVSIALVLQFVRNRDLLIAALGFG